MILNRLDEDKAQDVVFVDLKGKSAMADGLVVASGRSHRHVGAMADHLLRTLPDQGYGTVRVEGMKANRPTPATYEVKSVPIAPFDVEQPRAVGLAPLKIFGIGGGPSAVGSVAIEQVAFIPAQPGARFRFSTKSQFHRLRAQVQQLNQQGGTISIRPVFDARKSNLGIGPKQGTWNGTIAGTPNPSFGKHRFQITGWFTSDDRSWVAALAPDLVTQ